MYFGNHFVLMANAYSICSYCLAIQPRHWCAPTCRTATTIDDALPLHLSNLFVCCTYSQYNFTRNQSCELAVTQTWSWCNVNVQVCPCIRDYHVILHDLTHTYVSMCMTSRRTNSGLLLIVEPNERAASRERERERERERRSID